MKENGKVVDAYGCPSHFLENLSKYSKDTKISTGHIFENYWNNEFNGLDLLKRLHEEGYVNLYMFTWSDSRLLRIPYYVKFLPKSGDYKNDVDRLLSE